MMFLECKYAMPCATPLIMDIFTAGVKSSFELERTSLKLPLLMNSVIRAKGSIDTPNNCTTLLEGR
jgi:hypothetical protein